MGRSMGLLTTTSTTEKLPSSTPRASVDFGSLEASAIVSKTAPRVQGNLIALLVTAAWVVALFALLMGAEHRIPRPDEGHFSSAAYNLAHFGFLGTTSIDADATGLLRINERTYFLMPLYLLLQAGWLKLFPATIFSIRILNLVLLVPTLWCIYYVVRNITGNKAIALITVALLPLDYAFMFATISARPDVLCLLLSMAAIASYLKLRTRSFHQAILAAAFFMALSVMTHPNVVIHAAVLGALILYYDHNRIDIKAILGAVALGCLVFSPWALYISKDIAAFKAQMSANALNNHRFAASLNPIRLIVDELGRYANAYGLLSEQMLPKLKAAVLLPYAAGLALAFFWPPFRSLKGMRILLAGWAICFGVQCVFNQKLSVYMINILPYYAALIAALVIFLLQKREMVGRGVVAVLASVMAVQAGGMVISSFDGSENYQRQAANFVEQQLSAAHTINGSVVLLYDMGFDSRLKEDHALGLTTGKRPDVIVVDDNYRESFGYMAKNRPELFTQVQSRINEYGLVKKFGTYSVYLRPDVRASDHASGTVNSAVAASAR